MNKKLQCYKVTVKCTNSSNDTFFVPDDKELSEDDFKYHENGEYYDCQYKTIYIITANPKKIYEQLGHPVIESIEKIGIGYNL